MLTPLSQPRERPEWNSRLPAWVSSSPGCCRCAGVKQRVGDLSVPLSVPLLNRGLSINEKLAAVDGQLGTVFSSLEDSERVLGLVASLQPHGTRTGHEPCQARGGVTGSYQSAAICPAEIVLEHLVIEADPLVIVSQA